MTKARDLANIISGGFTADDIPNINTAKITSGTFADARLPATALNSNVDLTTLSASNLTSGTVADARIPNLNASKITAGTIASARLGSGTASSSTFLRGDGTFAEAGGGDMVKLGSTTLSSSVSSISFDGLFSSAYKKYQLVGTGLLTNSAMNNHLRIRQGNSDKTDSGYAFARMEFRTIHSGTTYFGTTPTGSSGASSYEFSGLTTSNSNFATFFTIDIYDPQNSVYKFIHSTSGHWYNHDGSTGNWYLKKDDGFVIYRGNTSAFSGVTVYPSSGNYTAGNVSLYGLKI